MRTPASALMRALPSRARLFHSTAQAAMPRAVIRGQRVQNFSIDDFMDEEPAPADTTAAGHHVLQQQRQDLYYMRVIEHEAPKLAALRKPFVPPSSSAPLVVRSITYLGEEHPAAIKRVAVVPVAHLPLRDETAIHKAKLLAGTRWTSDPPKDAGVGFEEGSGKHGYIKVSCEDFPKPAMNLKWISDTFDRLIEEANKTEETFKDVPVDTRYIESRQQKAKNGEHRKLRAGHRPTIHDFPKEWLPDLPTTPTSTTTA